jgi:prolyl oligopeptidase
VHAAIAAADGPPVAPVRNVADDHWGVKVDDPYRYMENLKDPDVQAWFKGQSDYTSGVLAKLPGRDELLARIKELDNGRPYRISQIHRMRDGRLFYLKINAGEILGKLYTRSKLDGEEKLLVDPSVRPAPDGGHYSLSFAEPSPDGRRVTYGLALSGSEQDVLHVVDVASGTELSDTIDRMEDGYTAPQWLPDGSGFYYSRRQKLPADAPATEVYKRSVARLHRLGTDADADPAVFGMDLWPNVTMADVDFPSIVLARGSKWAIGKIKHGDSNPLTLYAAPLGTTAALSKQEGAPSPWTLVCDVPDSVVDFAVHGDQIYL